MSYAVPLLNSFRLHARFFLPMPERHCQHLLLGLGSGESFAELTAEGLGRNPLLGSQWLCVVQEDGCCGEPTAQLLCGCDAAGMWCLCPEVRDSFRAFFSE